MKILLRVVGVLAVFITIAASSLGAYRNFEDAQSASENNAELAAAKVQLETLKKQRDMMTGQSKIEMDATVKQAEEAIHSVPSASTFTIAGIIMIVMGLLSLVSGIFLFSANPKTKIILLAIIGFALIVILISPSQEGMTKASNRAVAIAVSVPAILGALFAFLIFRKSVAK